MEQHGLRGVSKAGKCGLQESTERASPAPVPSHVQYVQLRCVSQLRGQRSQAVVPQGEDAESQAASNLGWQCLQVVPVHIEVSELGQVAQGVWQGLGAGRVSSWSTPPRRGVPSAQRTVSRFSVSTSSDRFSQPPMASVTSHRRFWSTFRMDNCFSWPGVGHTAVKLSQSGSHPQSSGTSAPTHPCSSAHPQPQCPPCPALLTDAIRQALQRVLREQQVREQ